MNEDVVQEVKEKEEVDYSKFETLLLNYFNGMKEMIASLNQKDRNLLDLGKELSDYRQGLESVMFKSLASYLIGFRESLVKQKDDLEKFDYDLDTLKDYFSLFKDSYEVLLADIGLTQQEDGTILYNSKDILASVCEVEELSLPKEEDKELEKPHLSSFDDIERYLKENNEEMIRILKEKEVVDLLISQCIKQTKKIKEQECQVILYPVLRKLVRFKERISSMIEEIQKEEDKESYLNSFKKDLEELISEMDDILFESGVTIQSLPEVGSDYDPKTQINLGYVGLEEKDADLHGKVALAFTPAYLFHDKVLKKAKIKIYRFTK